MSGSDAGGGRNPRPGAHEPVGSVGEEAAKLLAALQGWAREHIGEESPGGGGGPCGARGSAGSASAYLSGGSDACRACPVCQVIALARGNKPESLEQLGHTASTLLHALGDWADSAGRSQRRRGTPVQKFDLTDDPEDPTWH